jgi:threonine dehydrogenase-like Zn-dependent dehydrogenase
MKSDRPVHADERNDMQGVVFMGQRRVELREFPDPEPGPDEVVVRIKASGMCGSDLHYYRGDATPSDTPSSELCIGGHEPAGVVETVGSAVDPANVAVGDRVMVHHYSGCGACSSCRTGWPQLCNSGRVEVYSKHAHGAHAPLMKVPASTIVPLDNVLSFEAGAAIGCGTGTAWGGLARLGDIGGSTLVVSGQGPVGLSGTMLATARGARVIAVDPAAGRRQQAEKFGAWEVVDPTAGDPVEAIRDLTRGEGAPLLLETSGATPAAQSGLDYLAQWGKGCFVGLGADVSFNTRDRLRSQMTLMTSYSMSIVGQADCAAFVAEHNLPVDDLFTDRWAIDQADEAYVDFDKQQGGKAVFVF